MYSQPPQFFGKFRVAVNTDMLFAGWEVRIVKNCDQAAFSSPRSQFFTIRTDRKPENNMFIYFFPAVNWFYRLQLNGFVYATLVIESACAPSTDDL